MFKSDNIANSPTSFRNGVNGTIGTDQVSIFIYRFLWKGETRTKDNKWILNAYWNPFPATTTYVFNYGRPISFRNDLTVVIVSHLYVPTILICCSKDCPYYFDKASSRFEGILGY